MLNVFVNEIYLNRWNVISMLHPYDFFRAGPTSDCGVKTTLIARRFWKGDRIESDNAIR